MVVFLVEMPKIKTRFSALYEYLNTEKSKLVNFTEN